MHHRRNWLLGFLIAAILCVAATIANLSLSELRPGNFWGLSYGTAAGLLLVGALLYAVRRRAPARGPGATSHWLQFHVYGGVLFLLLVLMHTGFRLPTGGLDWSLWLISLWVVAGGLAGAAIQNWIPRMLTSGLTTEVHFDRIEELAESLRGRAVQLAESSDPAIGEFFNRELAPVMAALRPRWIYFLDVTGGLQSHRRSFQYLARLLPPREAGRLRELETLFVAKLELDAHYTLQRALRWWLYGHVPFSLLLVVLLGFHIFSVLYY